MKSASSVGKPGGRFSMLKKVSAILALSQSPLPEVKNIIASPSSRTVERQSSKNQMNS